MFQSIGAIIGGFAIAFARGYLFAFIMTGYLPIYVFVIICVGGTMKKQAIEKIMMNAKLGKFTEE